MFAGMTRRGETAFRAPGFRVRIELRMLIISDNLNLDRSGVAKAVDLHDAGSIRELAHKIAAAGAQALDISVAGLAVGDSAEDLEWLVGEVQTVTEIQLSLDAGSGDAILAAAEKARSKPIINAFSVTLSRPEDVGEKLLPYAAKNGLEIILPLLGESSPPLDVDLRMELAADVVEKAETAGIPRDDIYIDPVVSYLISADGQKHSAAVLETMRLLAGSFDPPVKTVAGVGYVSKGNPPELRSPLNRTYLAMLAALGLDAALVDVLDPEMMRDVRLIRGMRNDSLYSVSDAELM